MKRYVSLFVCSVFLTLCCSCGSQDAASFDGAWYSTNSGYRYDFSDGNIFCEESYVTLDDGQKATGVYDEYDGYIDVYIIGYEDSKPFYLITTDQGDALCDTADGSGKIYFYRDKSVVDNLLNKPDESTPTNELNENSGQKTITNDFDSETNKLAYLHGYQIEIPQKWDTFADEVEGSLNILPDKELPIIFSFFTIDIDGKYDLTDAAYQQPIAAAIVEAFQPMMGECHLDGYSVPKQYFQLVGGTIVDITWRDVLHIKCSGNYEGVDYDGDIMVFYLNDVMYSLSLFQDINSHYDFSKDLAEMVWTVRTIETEEPSSSDQNVGAEDSSLSSADTSDIEVRFEHNYVDGDRLHLTVFTKNNSEETFSGNVYVTFYSSDGKDRLGSDTVIVDDLLPGRESWADVVVDAYRGTPKMAVDFSEVSFTPIKEVTASVDSEATEKTKSSFRWNFEGVSWYNDVTDIVVYTDGTCIVTVKSNPLEKGQFYASTIWSCGHDHGVKTVQVIDPNGSILAVY